MDDISELPPALLLSAICITLSLSVLVIYLVAAPRRDCFFFRWPAERRLIALLISPALLIVWPIALALVLMRGAGYDFYDD